MAEWQPIETLDLTQDQFVLLHQQDAIRLLYWESRARRWTYPDAPFAVYTGIVSNPTHWMPIPKAPQETQEQSHEDAMEEIKRPVD